MAGGTISAEITDNPFLKKDGEVDFSHSYNGYTWMVHGEVMAEFHIRYPFGSGEFATRVRLFHNIPRIDITTSLVNNDEWVRYRVALPTTIREGKIFHEIPFGAIERGEWEFAAQNWIDYSDGEKGVALLNRGLPGNNVTDGIMMLSVLKCTTFVEYPEIGGYKKGVLADGGFEKGKEHSFDYAIISHSGDWRGNRIYQKGLEFNNPLLVQKAGGQSGCLPRKTSFVSISAANVIVSMVKKSNHAVILRVYEAEGRRMHNVSLQFHWDINSVFETDLIEENKCEIKAEGNQIFFDILPFEIKTFKIKFEDKIRE